jgi:hypothetical protein
MQPHPWHGVHRRFSISRLENALRHAEHRFTERVGSDTFQKRTRPPTSHSPRESESSIYRDHGSTEPIEAVPQDFLVLLAESVTLTIQSAADDLARNMAWQLPDRATADAQVETLQRLLEDRRLILAAVDGYGVVPRAVLMRHAWLAVREAKLNGRDAPDSWDDNRVVDIAEAAASGERWLMALGLTNRRATA